MITKKEGNSTIKEEEEEKKRALHRQAARQVRGSMVENAEKN